MARVCKRLGRESKEGSCYCEAPRWSLGVTIPAPRFPGHTRVPIPDSYLWRRAVLSTLFRADSPYLLQVEDSCWNSLHTLHCLLWIWRLFIPQNILVEVQLPFYRWVIRLKIEACPGDKQFPPPEFCSSEDSLVSHLVCLLQGCRSC